MNHDPYANPRKTTTIRRLGAVEIAALKAAVLAIPEAVWDAENADKPNRFEALDKTRHIVSASSTACAIGAPRTTAPRGPSGARCLSR